MTSMLLTESSAAVDARVCACADMLVIQALSPVRRGEETVRSPFLAAVAQRDLLLRRVLVRAVLDHLAHQRAIARHERREVVELLAVPLLELDHARAFVIEAARLHRREETGRAELLQ